MTTRNNPTNWLAIIQGNTHQRRGWFQGSRLISQEILPSGSTVEWSGEIWGLSVAGTLPGRRITTADIPLQDMYPGLGADRALGLWAALHLWGSPVLLVDAGTALTFTAGVEGRFVGGAILAGWQSQAKALHELTQSLPLATPRDPIPSRWARDTLSAIDSGLTYG
ncbi:MAG: type III pantothenate kinase, partial [Thermostichales cyanobacterium GMQP_bins_62]